MSLIQAQRASLAPGVTTGASTLLIPHQLGLIRFQLRPVPKPRSSALKVSGLQGQTSVQGERGEEVGEDDCLGLVTGGGACS